MVKELTEKLNLGSLQMQHGEDLTGGLLETAAGHKEALQHTKIAVKLEEVSLEDLSRVQALGGSTLADRSKKSVVTSVLFRAELDQIEKAQNQLVLIKGAYSTLASLQIAHEYTSNTGRASWDDLAAVAEKIKNDKLRSEGLIIGLFGGE